MTRLRLPALFFSCALAAFFALAASEARAGADGEDPRPRRAAAGQGGQKQAGQKPGSRDPGQYVKRLKPEELAYLRKKMPGWDGLDARRKEHIAREVIRLRNLSPEQSKRLRERLERLGRRGTKSRGWSGSSRGRMFRFSQVVGERIWSQLPESSRKEAGVRGIRPSLVKMVLFHKVLSRVAKSEGKQFTRKDLATVPKHWRKRAETYLAVLEDEGADARKKREARERLGGMRVYKLWEGLRRTLAEANEGREVDPAEVVGAAEARWPEAFKAVLANVSKDPARFYKSIEQKSRRYGGKSPFSSGRGKLGKSELAWSVLSLERLATQNWKDRPELQARTDAVIRDLLIEGLGEDPAAVAQIPPFKRPEARRKMMMRLLGKHLRGLGGRGDMRGWGEEGRRRSGRGGPPGGARRPGSDGRPNRQGDAKPGDGSRGDKPAGQARDGADK